MDTPTHKQTILPLKEDMRLMVEEILSPFNRWVTGQEIGHEPNHNECVLHFIDYGGVERFRQEHHIQEVSVVA